MKLHAGGRNCLASLASVAAALLSAPAGHAITLPSGFDHQPELTGLTRPTKIAWAPDGRRFVAEKDGIVRVAGPTGTSSEVLLDISQDVNNVEDRGLLGLAVDSDFANHPYLYLLYTYDVNKATNPDSDAPTVGRLTRIEVSADNQVLANETLLGSYVTGPCPAAANDIDCIPADGRSHSIGTVISAPDGTLFVGNGDAADYGQLDPLSLRTYDERSMAGKILHVDREGRGLPGHPFCESESNLDRVCAKLWAKGFRNPFRFTRQPDGSLLVADVGWTSAEEINRVVQGGKSYGWPCYEGNLRTPGWEDRDECVPEYAKEGGPNAHASPIYAYPHDGVTSFAIEAGPRYTGGSYPDTFVGSNFFGDIGQGFIKRISIDGNGVVTGVHDFATGWNFGVDLTLAPGGDLVWADLNGWGGEAGFVGRIVYSSSNSRPTADARANPTSGDVPLEVHFDGSHSSDPDGQTLTYDWDFGDGSAHGTGASPIHSYAANGTYLATLTVSDGERNASDTVTIDVGNTAPVPHIDEPAPEALYRDGVPLTLRGSADDADEGELPADALEWDVILHHGLHTHSYGSFRRVDEVPITPYPDHDADSHYEIKLTAHDSDGASASTTIAIRPETTPLHLLSEPAGAPLSYAGAAVTAPHHRNSAIGFKTTVSAAGSFEREGRTWLFDRWSDGGARAHDITVPAADTTLTAVYRESSGPLLGVLPGAPLSPPARWDRQGPRLGFDSRRGLDLRHRRLKGVTDDPAGTRHVLVALARVERGRCRWLARKPRGLARRAVSCARPRWIAARLHGRRWRLRLPGAMTPGAYALRLRAYDKLGNRSTRLRDGRARVRLRVRASATGRAARPRAAGRSGR